MRLRLKVRRGLNAKTRIVPVRLTEALYLRLVRVSLVLDQSMGALRRKALEIGLERWEKEEGERL